MESRMEFEKCILRLNFRACRLVRLTHQTWVMLLVMIRQILPRVNTTSQEWPLLNTFRVVFTHSFCCKVKSFLNNWPTVTVEFTLHCNFINHQWYNHAFTFLNPLPVNIKSLASGHSTSLYKLLKIVKSLIAIGRKIVLYISAIIIITSSWIFNPRFNAADVMGVLGLPAPRKLHPVLVKIMATK